jgi:hypothetical protein
MGPRLLETPLWEASTHLSCLLTVTLHSRAQSTSRVWTGDKQTLREEQQGQGAWPDLCESLAVLCSPATQQLHHVLGTLGHRSLDAQSVLQLVCQQLRACREEVSAQPSALSPA